MQFLLSMPTVCQILPKGVVGVLGPSSSPASSSIISNICGEKEVSGHVPCWVGLCHTPLLSFVLPKPSAAPRALCPHCPLSPCPSSRHAACLKLGVATCLQHSRTSLAEVPCWSHLFAAESSPGSAVPPNDQS